MHLLNTRLCRYTCIYITPTVQTLHYCPAGAWRWNDVILTSIWRHHVILTSCACWVWPRQVCKTLSDLENKIYRVQLGVFLTKLGWSGGAMVLGKLPVPGRPTSWITVGQGPTALAVGAVWDCVDIFILIYPFSPLSPSLWGTAWYRLKYCLKGPLNPKTTNQPTNKIWTQIPPFFICSAWLYVKEL